MFRLDVHLKDIEAIKRFVNITNRYPFHIALRQDRALIDAKSLMGIFSLDHSRPVMVEAYGKEAHVLRDALEEFAV